MKRIWRWRLSIPRTWRGGDGGLPLHAWLGEYLFAVTSIATQSLRAQRRWSWPQQSTGFLMITPAIILLLMVILYTLSKVFRLSFFGFIGLRDQQATFAWLRNFVSLKDDRICWFSMKNMLIVNLFFIIFILTYNR